jgi:aspartyl-tRNA(Asn)/glutamyl-tRNA(Gln) amidotransferase subunit A
MMKNHNIFLSKNTLESNKTSVAVKDNICVDGYNATCGSLALKDYYPGYNATAVEKLLKYNYSVAGKTNMDEFAMGSTGLNSAYGIVENPKHKDYIAGGSSSGSAAAVASGEVNLALGSDTGGSVRIPASFCEVYGFKPTYGAISRYGLIPFASSLDVIGILGNCLIEIIDLYEVINGKDFRDSLSINIESDIHNSTKPKIAFIDLNEFNISEEIINHYENIYFKIGNKYKSKKIKLKYIYYWLSVYYIISSCEAVSNLSRYDNKLFGNFNYKINNYQIDFADYRTKTFGSEVKRRIMTGNFALLNKNFGKFFTKASKIRNEIKKEIKRIFDEFDFIITPTSPVLPYKPFESDVIKNYKIDLFTCGASLAGNPAISIPSKNRIDVFEPGIQIIGKYAGDYDLLSYSKEIEELL